MSFATALTTADLHRHASRVTVPCYDREALTPSVVHIGVGSFHRSHQATYFDDLAQQGVRAWGLVGVGLHRPEMRAALSPQDGLYTVVTRGPDGDRARVIGAIRRYLYAPEERGAVVEALADPRTRVVTLTITGNGYALDAEALADLRTPTRPASALGFLVEALDRRRRAGLPPFTVLSCDNLPDNGALARSAVVGLARRRDDRLAAWIEEHGAFPNSMVDRITPKTSAEDCEMVAREFGVRDRWPVMTEPFRQWVIEDEFADGRPPLDAVGVQFVHDVRPYALAKTRLLNGAHCALGPLGHLAGHRTLAGALADPLLGEYVARLMSEEIAPLLPAVPGLDLEAYQRTLLQRFRNPRIGDRLLRLCRNGSAKIPAHLLSSIEEARSRDCEHELLTLAVAGWMRYLRGVDERGAAITLDDPLAGRLRRLAIAGGTDPKPLLGERTIFGSLSGDASFAAALRRALIDLERAGARGAVRLRLVRDRSLAA